MITLAQMRLTDLILDPRCQMRVEFSEAYALELADYLEMGGSLPPLDGFRAPELRRGPAILADGWHRRRARELLGQPYVEVKIHPGGLRDAILFATHCNAKSPKRPEVEDFRKAIATLIMDPEWGKWSDRKIALWCGKDRKLVGRVREYLAELSGSKGQITQDGILVERGGTTYVQKFRDMTPRQQAAAVEAETESHWPTWEREIREGLEQAERCAANRGDPFGHVMSLTQQALAALRPVEAELARQRRAARA